MTSFLWMELVGTSSDLLEVAAILEDRETGRTEERRWVVNHDRSVLLGMCLDSIQIHSNDGLLHESLKEPNPYYETKELVTKINVELGSVVLGYQDLTLAGYQLRRVLDHLRVHFPDIATRLAPDLLDVSFLTVTSPELTNRITETRAMPRLKQARKVFEDYLSTDRAQRCRTHP